jgi:hypothetical protein
LAYIYSEDLIVARDEVEISYWQERAAEFGDKASMKKSALNYFEGKGSPRNRGKALYWLESFQSHPAPIDRNSVYFPGEYEAHMTVQSVLPEDYSILLLSADLMSEVGWSGSNPKMAKALYEKLVSKGSFGATLRLAKVHLAEEMKGSSARKGVDLLKKLYERNKDATFVGKIKYAAEASYLMSQCYAKGTGVKSSETRYVNWLEISAASGFQIAQYELGTMYANGDGVAVNLIKGHELLLRAAKRGDVKSQLYLARTNLNEPVQTLREDRIVDWLKALVDSGSGEARMLLRKYGIKYKEPTWERKAPEEKDENEKWNPWIPVKAA